MSGRGQDKKYDVIFVGTSMICVIEAVYQSLCGKSVLMIDRQKDMGGAWLSLEIFGLHDVENAIHYFLPDPHAFDFMRDVLTWDVIPSPRKYRAFPLPLLGYWRLPYDYSFGRFIGKILEGALNEKKREILPKIFGAVKDALSESRQPSYYVKGGAPEMLRKVKEILLASDVEVEYSAPIERIHIDKATQTVKVSVGERKFLSKAIFFTHGSRISNLTGSSGPIPIQEKIHQRPAVHLLVRDESPSSMYECIFTADPLVKYVHDVTRFTRESAELAGRKKLFVLALHKDIQRSEGIYSAIFEKLKRAGMVGKNAVLENPHWWDAFLPSLDDADLQKLKAEFGSQVEFLKTENFGSQVEFLKTENFARGIGYHARRWAMKIRFPGKSGLHARTRSINSEENVKEEPVKV